MAALVLVLAVSGLTPLSGAEPRVAPVGFSAFTSSAVVTTVNDTGAGATVLDVATRSRVATATNQALSRAAVVTSTDNSAGDLAAGTPLQADASYPPTATVPSDQATGSGVVDTGTGRVEIANQRAHADDRLTAFATSRTVRHDDTTGSGLEVGSALGRSHVERLDAGPVAWSESVVGHLSVGGLVRVESIRTEVRVKHDPGSSPPLAISVDTQLGQVTVAGVPVTVTEDGVEAQDGDPLGHVVTGAARTLLASAGVTVSVPEPVVSRQALGAGAGSASVAASGLVVSVRQTTPSGVVVFDQMQLGAATAELVVLPETADGDATADTPASGAVTATAGSRPPGVDRPSSRDGAASSVSSPAVSSPVVGGSSPAAAPPVERSIAPTASLEPRDDRRYQQVLEIVERRPTPFAITSTTFLVLLMIALFVTHRLEHRVAAFARLWLELRYRENWARRFFVEG